MDYVCLGSTRLRVSRACLGTMTFGAQADRCTAERILASALDAGVNFVDTANIYAEGRSEELLGNALRARRHDVILASKVGHKNGSIGCGLSRADMLRAAEASLRRLQTDYLDVYYLHQPDPDVLIEETLETMEQLIREGKVRFPAFSNYASWQVSEMLCTAERRGYQPALIGQQMYNLVARGIEPEFLPMAKRYGISTVVYNPLAGGLLTGKHQGRLPQPGSRFVDNEVYKDRYWQPVFLDAVEALGQVAWGIGRNLTSLALNWLNHRPGVDCIVLGATSAAQLSENLQALEDGPLPQGILDVCDQVWKKLRGPTPQYNR